MIYTEIHVWGDSLARGVVYNDQRGRYAISTERFSTRLQATLGCKVENHSIMGATVIEGFAMFEKSNPAPGALCVVEYGGNDCDLDWAAVAAHPDAPREGKVPLRLFEETLTTFVHTIRQRGMKPLLVTPLPLHAQRYFNWVTRGLDAEAVLQALGDVNHIYRWQERYSIAVRRVSQATHCRLFDARDVMLSQPNYENLMCVDGIHPNDAGHRLLADATILQSKHDPDRLEQTAAGEALQAQQTAILSAARVS